VEGRQCKDALQINLDNSKEEKSSSKSDQNAKGKDFVPENKEDVVPAAFLM
jgi:hypothetical protein